MIQCKICNRELNSYTGLASHINQVHNLLSKDYYIQYLKQKDEGVCPVCGKDTQWFSLRKGFRKHCSRACSTADPEVYKLKSETEFKNTGYYNVMENPTNKQKMFNLLKLPEIQQKRIESCKNNNGQGTGFQIKSVKEKAEKTIIDKYGVDNVFKLPEIHQIANKTKEEKYNNKNYNNREKAKETYYNKTGYYIPLQNPEVKSKIKKLYTFNNIKFDSSWELAYYIWLKDHNIDFEYQPNTPFEYIIDNIKHLYYPDFLINEQYIEIKGKQFFNEKHELINPYNNTKDYAKYECMIKNNVKIISDEEIKPILDYINKKYGKNYLKQFKYEK